MTTTRKLLMSRPSTSGFGSQVVYGSQTFSGSISFTVPVGVTSISVLLVDGGQSGSFGSNGSVSSPGAGGAGGIGGARRYLNNIPVTPGQVITGTVGDIGGATSFGSFVGWVNGVSSGNGESGANGITADTLPCGGDGGDGGGASSLVDAGAVGPEIAAPPSVSNNGSAGANGVWPGGAGGGGGGGAGGRTPQGTGFTGIGAAGGTGAFGAIRIVWPGNLRQYPSDNTEDWSAGEAGIWSVVRSASGTLNSVIHAEALGWYASLGSSGLLSSLDDGITWSSTNASSAQGSPGSIYEMSANSTKIGVKGNYIHLRDLTGSSWIRGFSGLSISTDSTVGGLASSDSGVWVARDIATRTIHVSRDNGLTRDSFFTINDVPNDILWLGGARWLLLTGSSSFIMSDDDFQTTRIVTSIGGGLLSQTTSDHDGKGIIIGSAGPNLIIRSIDNGETWASVSLPGITVNAVYCNKYTGVWVLCGAAGVLYRSEDGILFQAVQSGTSAALRACGSSNSATWLSVGASGTITRSTV